MVDVYLLVATALLVAGVAGSVLPAIPGPGLSLAGVLLYWWSTGYADPSPVVLGGFVVVGLGGVAVDLFAGAISARAGGASKTSSAVAGVAGLVLFFVAGPLGVVLGVAGSVFAVEFYRRGRTDESAKAAVYAAVGMLGSALVQAMITLSMLAAFLLVVFV